MAATPSPLRLLLPPPPFPAPPRRRHLVLALSSSDQDFEGAPEPYETQPPAHIIERRQKAALLRQSRSQTALDRPEPPNFEIGWKRTIPISHEKPKGYVIADFLEKLEALMGREGSWSAELLAKTGGIVAERAREEADILVEGGEVEERMVTELNRVLRLMEMDLEMVRAAVKEETRKERVQQARARCRQAILVALSF